MASLLVGINKFRHLPEAELSGCVNDVLDVRATRPLGQPVITLLDEQATRTAIVQAMEDLAALKPESVYIHISTHGTQVRDADGDETDGLDEAICPHDILSVNGEWRNVITDDDLYRLLCGFPKETEITMVLDTCHSGTGARAFSLVPMGKPRFLPTRAVGHRRSTPSKLKVRPNTTIWSACRADQTASDYAFDGRFNGAFTYFWLKTQGEPKERLAQVRKLLNEAGFNQIPELDHAPLLPRQKTG